jgi:hypothetical protein
MIRDPALSATVDQQGRRYFRLPTRGQVMLPNFVSILRSKLRPGFDQYVTAKKIYVPAQLQVILKCKFDNQPEIIEFPVTVNLRFGLRAELSTSKIVLLAAIAVRRRWDGVPQWVKDLAGFVLSRSLGG